MKLKNEELGFLGKTIITMMFFLVLTACATTQENQSLYQVKMTDDSQLINVSRDDKTYKKGQRGFVKNCPTEFYINGEKLRNYSVNDQFSYYLEPGNYTLQVENCHGRCSSYDVDLIVSSKVAAPSFTLSVDVSGKPFIIRK